MMRVKGEYDEESPSFIRPSHVMLPSRKAGRSES